MRKRPDTADDVKHNKKEGCFVHHEVIAHCIVNSLQEIGGEFNANQA